MRKKAVLVGLGLVLIWAGGSALLRWEPAMKALTPRKYWRSKIMSYNHELERAKRDRVIKEIQLKKKILTGNLDVAQDVIMGIDQNISVSVVQGEIEKLKEVIVASDRAISDLEGRLAEAKERFNGK